MEVVEEEKYDEMKSEVEFIMYLTKKTRQNYKSRKTKVKEKSTMKKQWDKIKNKTHKFESVMD